MNYSEAILRVKSRTKIIYKLTAIKRDSAGNEISRRESAEIPNIFTNHGVEAMYGGVSGPGTDPGNLAAVVGTGSAMPAITDTALSSFLAGRYTPQTPAVAFTDLGSNQGYVQATYNTIFPIGTATGNISEVGAVFDQSNPDNSYPLCSRALVVDGLGNPTTFEVLADEELQLTQMFRVYVDYSDRVTVVNVNGVNYTVTLRPMGLSNSSYWRVFGPFYLENGSRILYGTAYTLADPKGTSEPSSSGAGAGGDNISQGSQGGALAYVASSKQRAAYLRRPTGNAENIVAMYWHIAGHGTWQAGFSPAIPKSSLERLTVTLMWSIDNTP